MTQLPLFEASPWSITQLTQYLRDILENDPTLQDIWVQGEISNFSKPSSGHLYFTLKDSACSLRCVMWRNTASRIGFQVRDGQAVEVHGSLNVYETAGQYQLYADLIRPVGEGLLYQEFLRLKQRLEAEGLFASERKRPIPALPQRIGIVTSPTGAALRDMLNTLRRRYPLAEIILASTTVQGNDAPPGILAALNTLNRLDPRPDVILIARGGGSIEDLWAFNDERVARAIATSNAPVISGIGHETDFTIADFVSDLRAPTPTAAAELATPDRSELLKKLTETTQLLKNLIHGKLTSLHWTSQNLQNRLTMRSPCSRIRTDRQRLDDLIHRSTLQLTHALQVRQTRLQGIQGRLDTLNPLSVLQRGYAMVIDSHGRLLRSVTQAHPGSNIQVRLQDGQFTAQITPDK